MAYITQWNVIEEFRHLKDPARLFGLLTLRELAIACGVPESMIRGLYRKKLIYPVLVSARDKKALWSPTTTLFVANIFMLRECGWTDARIRRDIKRRFRPKERDSAKPCVKGTAKGDDYAPNGGACVEQTEGAQAPS